ncbi:hypothetical protein [Rouxiella sp. WC2420]|uniref:Tail spike TSP1/Gp66 N-terminal domain-containing protein n=1 Tax=Rouxiella sp. WC2420 TaxID=3234145 RepID=A0AB39VNM3_9GAMM
MEQDHARQLISQENRFQDFLLDSGYEFLGQYENGPLTFTARNQFIRFDNQYYRINATTDVGFTTTGINGASFINDVTHLVLMDGDTLRQNLAGSDGASLIGFRESNVSNALSQIMRLEDIGVAPPFLGYDEINDLVLMKIQEALGDTNLLHTGSLSISHTPTGLTRGATGLSIRSGQPSTNAGNHGGLVPQVTGVKSAMELYDLGTLDVVALYSDCTLTPREAWKNVSSCTYSSNTATFSSADTIAASLIKVNSVLVTKHAIPCKGIVKSISGKTVTVDMWANSNSTTTTPSDNVGLVINPFNKGWAGNLNIIIPEDTDYITATGLEIGILNKGIQNPNSLNGIDMVVLDGEYGATAGFYAHGATLHSWAYGFLSAGNSNNFVSQSGVTQPYNGFVERSNATVGFRFSNLNAFATEVWAKTENETEVSPSKLTRIIDPNGCDVKKPELILQIGSSIKMPTNYPLGYINVPGITITLPAIADLPQAGYKYTFRLFEIGSYSFLTYNNESQINGYSTFEFTTTKIYQTVDIQFDGTYYQLFGPY